MKYRQKFWYSHRKNLIALFQKFMRHNIRIFMEILQQQFIQRVCVCTQQQQIIKLTAKSKVNAAESHSNRYCACAPPIPPCCSHFYLIWALHTHSNSHTQPNNNSTAQHTGCSRDLAATAAAKAVKTKNKQRRARTQLCANCESSIACSRGKQIIFLYTHTESAYVCIPINIKYIKFIRMFCYHLCPSHGKFQTFFSILYAHYFAAAAAADDTRWWSGVVNAGESWCNAKLLWQPIDGLGWLHSWCKNLFYLLLGTYTAKKKKNNFFCPRKINNSHFKLMSFRCFFVKYWLNKLYSAPLGF